MKNSIIKAINYINLISALFLIASLILREFKIHEIGFYLFFGSYLVEIFAERKWNNIKLNKRSLYFFVLLLFFLLALIYLPFENSHKYLHVVLDKRLPLLGFSIVGILGLNNKFRLSYILNTFIITSVIAIFYLLFYRIGIIEFLKNPLREELFTDQRILWVNSHMAFNFYLNVSLISVWFILNRTWNHLQWWKRLAYFFSMTIIFSTLSISEGRSGFLIGILLMLSFVFFEIFKRKKILGLIIGILVPFLLIGIASTHKRISEKSLENEPRLFLWESAWSVIKEKPVLGFGINDAQDKFDSARAHYQTEEYKQIWIESKHLDSHNQFLQTTMEFGILGLSILLFLFFYPLFIIERRRRFFSILLLTLCLYQSLFDMFVTGPFATIFGLITLMIFTVKNDVLKINE